MDAIKVRTRMSDNERDGRLLFINKLDEFLGMYKHIENTYPDKEIALGFLLHYTKAHTRPDNVNGREWIHISKWISRLERNYFKLLVNTKFVQIEEYSMDNFIYSLFSEVVQTIGKTQTPVGSKILKHKIWVPEDLANTNSNLDIFTYLE